MPHERTCGTTPALFQARVNSAIAAPQKAHTPGASARGVETSEHPTHKEHSDFDTAGGPVTTSPTGREKEETQLMLIFLGESGLVLGSISVSTPSLSSAATFWSSTTVGSATRRLTEPNRRSRR